MSKLPLAVIDYGLGNLASLSRALRAAGAADFVATSDPALLASSERAILPGVGAFGDGMAGLRERGLVDAVRAFAASGRPLLGICLGMQLLMDEGSEFGTHGGLGLIPGRSIPFPKPSGVRLKLPHVGWNSLDGSRWHGSPLEGLPCDSHFYFVHSFVAAPKEAGDVLAVSSYGGASFCAAVRRGNVFGVQFHPEKSAAAGLRLLSNFANVTKRVQ